MRLTEASKKLHTTLVKALVAAYESKGYYVQADHVGHVNGSPPEINGHIPDVAAYHNGSLYIIAEAETCDTVSNSDTCEQWKAFSRSQHQFDIIVPKSCFDEAQRQASIWGITVDQWWTCGV